MIKLIGLDLDGTLLRNDKSISKRSVECLKHCDAQGVEYIIVTGRNKSLVTPILAHYGLSCEMLLNSGHEYVDRYGTTLEFVGMNYTSFESICSLLLELDFHISIYTPTGRYIFTEKNAFFDRHIKLLNQVAKRNISENMDDLSNPAHHRQTFLSDAIQIQSPDYLIEHQIPILKIDARSDDEVASQLLISKIESCPDLCHSSSFGSFIEITENTTNKGLMLQKIAEIKGYQMDEVAVFGDSTNDMDMLTMFKNSYAMGNASEKVKECATYVIDSNQNDGVAKAIEEILKENQEEMM